MKDEDFVNYQKPSMFVAFPSCTFKCERECGQRCCQNGELAHTPDIEVSPVALAVRYAENPITHALVLGGLEPLDSLPELLELMKEVRKRTRDDVVIYTGYTKEELSQSGALAALAAFPNVLVKFGRYVPGQRKHYDETLGVSLAGENQYAEKIS